MLAYDPEILNGAVFELTEVNYNTDQGQYSLNIDYGAPSILTPIDLNVHGKVLSDEEL